MEERDFEVSTLTMTRKSGDRIVINEGEIDIEVVFVRGSAVRLRFRAPKYVVIRRGELVLSNEFTLKEGIDE